MLIGTQSSGNTFPYVEVKNNMTASARSDNFTYWRRPAIYCLQRELAKMMLFLCCKWFPLKMCLQSSISEFAVEAQKLLAIKLRAQRWLILIQFILRVSAKGM
ncbi:hypothetical protein ACLK1S_10595 [Escherichia coli]